MKPATYSTPEPPAQTVPIPAELVEYIHDLRRRIEVLNCQIEALVAEKALNKEGPR